MRTCNVKTILRGLIESASIAKNFEAYRGVIRSLLDEAFAVIKKDCILEGYHPVVSAYLEPWRKKEIGEKDVGEIERLAIVMLGNLDHFWKNGVSMLLGLLEKADKKRKKELYSLTMNIAVETVTSGRSPENLFSPDGTRIVTASNDKTAKVWGAKTGITLLDLKGQTELLLSIAYLDAKQPQEAAKWHTKAVAWLDRYQQPMQVISSLGAMPTGVLVGLTELSKSPLDPRYNSFDWETWYECDVSRAEVEAKLR